MNKYKKMGVINLTPDSFSDGSSTLSPKVINSKISKLLEWCDIIDCGAESTAPFNKQISAKEEIYRFESLLFPALKDLDIKTISIDTYKLEVFEYVYKHLRCERADIKIILNDVSGDVSDELIKLFRRYDDFDYVLSHNLVKSRDNTNAHMDAVKKDIKKDKFVDFVISEIENKLDILTSFEDRIIIDPCFGFSKTREQNHILLKSLNKFINNFSSYRCLIGISRKSFLRFPPDMDAKDPVKQIQLDALASHIYNSIESNNVIYRVHSDFAFELLDLANQLS